MIRLLPTTDRGYHVLLQFSILAVLLVGVGSAEAGSLPVSEETLTGTWECGPTTMKKDTDL